MDDCMIFSYVLHNAHVWRWPGRRPKLVTLKLLNVLCMTVYWMSIYIKTNNGTCPFVCFNKKPWRINITCLVKQQLFHLSESNQLQILIGLLTQHCHLKWHLFHLGMVDSQRGGKRKQVIKMALHVPCDCKALATWASILWNQVTLRTSLSAGWSNSSRVQGCWNCEQKGCKNDQ
jgi:hypothetical protein